MKAYNGDMNVMSTDTKFNNCDMNVLHDDMNLL